MKIKLYGGFLLLGILLGVAVLSATRKTSEGQEKATSANSRSVRAAKPSPTRMQRLISAESRSMDEHISFDKATDILYAEGRSPMRTRAFLKNRIHLMTYEQLTEALRNGEIQSEAEIKEAAMRMTTEDLTGTFQAFLRDYLFQFDSMEKRHVFSNSMLETGARTDALGILKQLQAMPRGGAQQSPSLRFSAQWAKVDPAAAAANFDDLVYLRNMTNKNKGTFTGQQYAAQIVKPWHQQNEEALRDYVQNLPAGEKKNAFQAALKKL